MEARYIALWQESEHGSLPGTIVDIFGGEQAALMPLPPAFNGFVEMGMGWSLLVLSGTIRLAGAPRSSGERDATRRHPLTRGVGVLLTQC